MSRFFFGSWGSCHLALQTALWVVEEDFYFTWTLSIAPTTVKEVYRFTDNCAKCLKICFKYTKRGICNWVVTTNYVHTCNLWNSNVRVYLHVRWMKVQPQEFQYVVRCWNTLTVSQLIFPKNVFLPYTTIKRNVCKTIHRIPETLNKVSFDSFHNEILIRGAFTFVKHPWVKKSNVKLWNHYNVRGKKDLTQQIWPESRNIDLSFVRTVNFFLNYKNVKSILAEKKIHIVHCAFTTLWHIRRFSLGIMMLYDGVDFGRELIVALLCKRSKPIDAVIEADVPTISH